MSARRRLVSRQTGGSTAEAESSPSRPRHSGTTSTTQGSGLPQIPALPPYEAPAFPLTADGRRSLDELTSSHDYRKYKKHLGVAIKYVTTGAAESNDLLYMAKERVRKLAEKRAEQETPTEKSEMEERAEKRVEDLEDKVGRLTTEAEAALRELIDFGNELAQHETLMAEVSSKAATADQQSAGGGASSSSQRRRNRQVIEDGDEDGDADYENEAEDEDEDEAMAEAPGTQAAVLSPIELWKQGKENYAAEYAAKSMREKYAESNDYKGFKRVIHDALHPGADAPPVPNASTWFPNDQQQQQPGSARRRRRQNNTTDNTGNEADVDEVEEEIVFAGAVSSLKCPLTLKTFTEPYSNTVCKHTFEKSAILDMHSQHAVVFGEPSQSQGRRGRGRHAQQPEGPRVLKCPEAGCDAMLEVKDFFLDEIVMRKVKRAQMAAEREEMGLDDEEGQDGAPEGTQDRPAAVGDDTSIFGNNDGDEKEGERARAVRVKKERFSRARSNVPPADEIEDEE